VRNDSVDQSEEVMAVIYPGNMSAGMTNIKTVRNKSVGLNEPSRNTDENMRLYQACTSVRRYTSLYGDGVHPHNSFFNYSFNTPTGDTIIYDPYGAVSSASPELHISDTGT
jgi:hypothetical protein